MNAKTAILEAAAELLATSPIADVSTRAVCEAAGVGAPTLYRHFGDKEGLLSAVVDHGFEQYLSGRRAAKPSADPVSDLRAGWDSHVAFALSHPSYYRLMYSPAVRTPPEAAAEAQRLLLLTLERCASAGRLRVAPAVAAQLVMAANVGVALMLITHRDLYSEDVSPRVRDAVHAAILTPGAAAAGPAGLSTAATQLGALLGQSTSDGADTGGLSRAELALMREWLLRLSTP
ncbi:TetR/AcrR family transcriptional regulator [Amycolatopsis sp. H20-H5]|uniref:TetR/AcrR family transcriptional regulator n=1 Tax=Amycolatopsis sp. H20-H5 TaxID=3046309 RepID=UPI002DB8C9A6|nr:TetR/AcrR family transcriptional regulator [Amycolatopsis sp. H20-H5]MEC3976457.1 TetR/AcrR family transcriptional regulator [Amycolatopsis sp. H20-H5]